jgi:ferredoxin
LNLSELSAKQLLDIEGCTYCGECLRYCPVYFQGEKERTNPGQDPGDAEEVRYQ